MRRYDWARQWNALEPYFSGQRGVVGVAVENQWSGANSFRKVLVEHLHRRRPSQLVIVDGRDEPRATKATLLQSVAQVIGAVLPPPPPLPSVGVGNANRVDGDLTIEEVSVSIGDGAAAYLMANQLRMHVDAVRAHLGRLDRTPVVFLIDLLVDRGFHAFSQVITWFWRELWSRTLTRPDGADLVIVVFPHDNYGRFKKARALVSEHLELDATVLLPGTFDEGAENIAVEDLTDHLMEVRPDADRKSLHIRAQATMVLSHRTVSRFYDNAAIIVDDIVVSAREELA